MKKAALIATYCNTEEKIEVLLSNLTQIKNLGIDAIVLTLFPLPHEAYELSTFVIHTKENKFISDKEKVIVSWSMVGNGVRLEQLFSDYGYDSMHQYKRLLQFSQIIDYDYVYAMNYDLKITPEIEQIMNEGRKSSFFSRDNENIVSANLIALDKENSRLLSLLITKESYLANLSDYAETWLTRFMIAIGAKKEKALAVDLVTNNHFLSNNHSPFSDFDLFIQSDKSVSLFFYYIKKPIVVEIESNNKIKSFEITTETYVKISDDFLPDDSLFLIYDGVKVDLTERIKSKMISKIFNYESCTIIEM